MASPRAKYSQRARTVKRATAMATAQIGVKRTMAIATGMRAGAVRTRVQVIGAESFSSASKQVGCDCGTDRDYTERISISVIGYGEAAKPRMSWSVRVANGLRASHSAA